MEREERYEVNAKGALEVGVPRTLTPQERKQMVEELFSQNGWRYTLEQVVSGSHYLIRLENENLGIDRQFHLYHGNVRKEDPERSREEKKIQLGTDNDPRIHKEDGLILGFYVYEHKTDLRDAVIVAWPIEPEKNYPANPSLRVNMKHEILPAKNSGFYVDKSSGKHLVAFRPEFIYHYLEQYQRLQYEDVCEYVNLEDEICKSIIPPNARYESSIPHNRIVFGAPGTGKSFALDQERKALLGEGNEEDYERVTFHPDYSYANFVGTYKPVPCVDSDGRDAITYAYVPGPFMRIYVKAMKSKKRLDARPYLLLIEEINRANVAAVFGDIFQLLDRNEDGVSEYPIQASKDVREYLAKELGGEPKDYGSIRIPENLFLWATMNSADQGVFPMDTAFKRRWEFTYLGIDDQEDGIKGRTVRLGTGSKEHRVEWNLLRKAINQFLAEKGINEDKQLGPYFLAKRIVVPRDGTEIDREQFAEAFKNKVIMYLFEDAAKQKRPLLFEGCKNKNRYSEICREFDRVGIYIFCSDIVNQAGAVHLSAESEQ